jgi:hypothetical protein
MKTEVKKVISPVKENELSTIVNDTLATSFIEDSLNGQARKFSAADMWNLNKKQRSATEMRRWLN